ncbi:hypothetical protein E0504_36685 [Parafrankia sp. BMG5.11]|uniref:hypothetical protein n=1 Tax=Parafrankia sp. Ea1.12 TaxID=573499 RepID=UPI000DA4D032|nr:hypothetical protein [Parafrankia sp. Ea1.12]TCJ33679.1 hypothetical protein E0504_36685 [Parafrankia sp. BMG5.11]SQD99049.1 hypothetical protein FMEAI12_5100021 [Parafrankia sp. Ea1.12]
MVDARPVGVTWLLDALWRELGVAAAIEKAVADRGFTAAVERVLFALVANRAIEPMSKLSAAEWACEDVVIPGLSGMDDDQAYRALDSHDGATTAGPRADWRARGVLCHCAALGRELVTRGVEDRDLDVGQDAPDH